jgi:hypothetical protein
VTITYVGAGTATTGNNAAVTPGAVTGTAVGDLVLIQASIRNTGTGTVTAPAGWTAVKTQGSMTILGRFWQTGDAMPMVTFTAGVANADTIAQAIALRGVAPDALTASTTAAQANSSAANIAYPALDVPGASHAVILAVWKQDDASALTTPASYTAVGLASTTTGDDAMQALYYRIETTEADLGSGSITVTGGAAAVSSAIAIALHPAAAITIDPQDTWPPRVLVSVTGLVAGLDTVRVVRHVAGVETTLRSGTSAGATTDTSWLVLDAELPFGVPVNYKAIVNESARYESATATYTLVGGKVALTDAITGLAAETQILAWDSKTNSRRSTVFQVGARNIVVVGDRGQFAAEINFYFETETARTQFEALLTNATEGVIQVRQAGGYSDVDCYIAVLSDQNKRYSQDGSDERRQWTVTAVEVDGWAPALEAAGFTLADIYAFYGTSGTLATLAGDYATLLEVAQADWS